MRHERARREFNFDEDQIPSWIMTPTAYEGEPTEEVIVATSPIAIATEGAKLPRSAIAIATSGAGNSFP